MKLSRSSRTSALAAIVSYMLKVAGIMMLIGGIIGPAGFLALGIVDDVSHLAIPALAAAFLLPGGVLAVASGKKRPAIIYLAMFLGAIGGAIAVPSALIVLYEIGVMDLLQPLGKWFHFPFWTGFVIFPGLLGGLMLVKPKVAGILMLISAIIGPFGFIAYSLLKEPLFDHYPFEISAVASLLLIIAASIALLVDTSSKNPNFKNPSLTLPLKRS